MAGFANDILIADNVNFTGLSGIPGKTPTMTGNGELLIGSVASPQIKVGVLVSPDGSLNIGYSSPNITLELGANAPYFSLTPFIVGPDVHSQYSTIASAIAAVVSAGASSTSPANIYIKPQTSGYTENPVLVDGINLISFGGQVVIHGKLSMTTAGTASVNGFTLQTNSDFLLAVTGSAASILDINNCNFNCTNHTGVSFTSSSGSAVINLNYCIGDLGTTGIGLFTSSSSGQLNLLFDRITNSGGSTTASTASAGTVTIQESSLTLPLATTSGGVINISRSNVTCSGLNTTAFTSAGTGGMVHDSVIFSSGSASAVSVGTGTTVSLFQCNIGSTNTNAITGAGTVIFSNLTFINTSSLINTTTQNVTYTNLGAYAATGQPSILYTNNADQANVTGDGTAYTVTFVNKVYDLAGNFDGTSTFTAPAAGGYLVEFGMVAQNLTSAMTNDFVNIVTTAATYRVIQSNFFAMSANSSYNFDGSCIVNMSAGDTLTMVLRCGTDTKTVTIPGATNNTFRSPYLGIHKIW